MALPLPRECREVSGIRRRGPAVAPPWPAGPLLPFLEFVMYLRFVFAEAEPTTRRRIGIYQATPLELTGGVLGGLRYPPRRAFSGGRGVCWFKLTARRYIENMRDLTSRLE